MRIADEDQGITIFNRFPDDIVFVDELPHGTTGKVEKKTLHEKFKDHKLPAAGIDQVRGIIS